MNGKFESVQFPLVAGHEGAGIVESVGEGVTSFKPGDHVIPLFLPQCKKCKTCKHESANLCEQFLDGQLKGLMHDDTSRLSCRGQQLFVFLGCGTFAEYVVSSENNLCKINKQAPLDKICLIGCAITTGYGAAVNNAKVTAGTDCAVWGLGALGLAVIMGCKNSGASRIFAIDVNPEKFEIAKEFGATDFLNPNDLGHNTIQKYLQDITAGGVEFTFECVGNTAVMKQVFESTALGYGVCVVVGASPSDEQLCIIPADLLFGKTLKGTFFGCYKSIDSVPQLVEDYLSGKLNFDKMITHRMSLERINEAFDLLKEGKSIRTVIDMNSK